MSKRHSKLRKVIPLALSLAVGGAGTAYAQNTVNDSVFNTPTGDFVFVTDYMHKTNRNEKTDVNAEIKGGNVKKIYALDPSKAIKSRINFLNSARAKQFYSQEERLKLMGRYQNFLVELSKQKIAPSAKSLEGLSAAVSDGIIHPEELSNVEDGVYAIVKEGYDKKVGNYSVFYLTSIVSDKTPIQYQAKISKLEAELKEYQTPSERQIPVHPQPQQNKLREPQPATETPAQPQSQTEIPNREERKEKGYNLVSLIVQGNGNLALDSCQWLGGSLGLKYGNKNIALGVLVDGAIGLDDKRIEEYSAPLSAGRTASGTIDNTNNFSVGVSGELQLGPMIFGGGIDYSNWIKKTVEQILTSSGSVVKSNTNSKQEGGITGKGYVGFEVPVIDDAWKIGAVAGYSGKNGPYFGIRSVFRLNQPQKEK